MPTDWRTQGVRVVRSGELDLNTPQTPGMTRAAAITTARAGAEKLWAGTVDIEPDAKSGAHHHGPVEGVIYVVRPGADALRRALSVRPRGRPRRLHLRAPVRSAPGNQGRGVRAAVMRGRAVRAGGGRSQPRSAGC